MRVACALITHLRAKAELRRHTHLRDGSIAVVDGTGGKPLVVDSSAGTSVRAGMTLEQATSCHNDLIILDVDEPYYRRAFEDVVDALLGVSDRVEPAELGVAYARIDGLEALHGGETQAAEALLAAVPSYLRARIGVGDTKFTAFVAARTAPALRIAVCPDDAAGFLAHKPIDLLPVSGELKRSLRSFGVHGMGQLAALSPDILTDRFGAEGWLAWELCNGIDDRPVLSIAPAVSVVERASLPFASASLELMLASADILLRRAFGSPELRRNLVGSVTLTATSPDAADWTRSVRFKEPAASWERASAQVRAVVEAHPPEAPIEDLTVALGDIAGESGRQLGLLDDARDRRRDRIVETERKLRSLMKGAPALHKVVEVAPWHPIPELRALRVPLDGDDGGALMPLHQPAPVDVRESEAHRPLAVRLPSGWRVVSVIDDLWRFDLWWLPEPITRSYYSVTDTEGRRLVLFRDDSCGTWYRQPSAAA